jgi:hypothetical protein
MVIPIFLNNPSLFFFNKLTIMKKVYMLFFASCFFKLGMAQTPVPMSSQPGLSYIENFSDISNWANNFTSGIGANRFGSVPINATGTIPDGVRITTSSATFSSGTAGGVQKGSGNIVLLSTGSPDLTTSVAFDFFMDFTGVNAGNLNFDWAEIANSTGNRAGSVRVYWSTNGTTFTELTSAQVLNVINNVASSGSITNVALPSAFNNSSTARLRFYYYNGSGGSTGSRPKISIDNLTVTASPLANAVSVAAGSSVSEPSTSGNFTINLSTPAPAGGLTVNYSLSGTAINGTDYLDLQSGAIVISQGSSSGTVTLNAIDDMNFEGTETIILTINSVTAPFFILTPTASINLLDNDAPPMVSVASGANAAEPATDGSFIINLNYPAPIGGVTVNYTLSGTATLFTDYTDPLNGALVIPQGSSSGNIILPVIDDNVYEGLENINISLTSATNGYQLGTISASINLVENDPQPAVSVSAGTNAAEPSTNGSFTISFNTPTTGVTTVNYAYTGTSTFNTDYAVAYSAGSVNSVTSSGTLTVPAGTNSILVTVTPIDDNDLEIPETIILTLSSPSSPLVIGTASRTINLISNDLPVLNPISLTGGAYTQDFNTLLSSGSGFVLIPGWQIDETGSSALNDEAYTANNGGSTSGDTYSYGSNSDRALGTLQSGSLQSTFGAYFINNTGVDITSLKISYKGEEWRLGTASRTDQIDFQYSFDATAVSNGTWNDFNPLDFITPNTVGTGAKDGNANSVIKSYTIHNLTIAPGATFFIRWTDFDASSSDDGLAVDDFYLEPNAPDNTNPILVSVIPSDDAANVQLGSMASISFDEDILPGTGNIYIKKVSDNSIIQTIAATSPILNISDNTASFQINNAVYSTAYYVEVEPTAFKDYSGNFFAGISGNNSWNFTTEIAPPPGILGTTYSFGGCTAGLPDGFRQFSQVGSITWGCTDFGIDNIHSPLGSAVYGVQMNGFASGTNVPNVDWFISPPYNLTATTFPLLSFWSRTAFNGLPLQLKVSTDYNGGDPANATWTDINGKFPSQTSNVWTESSNINLSAFKQPNVYFAFVYTSSDDEGARWTLDDITVVNSEVAPPPSLTVSTTDIQFNFTAVGNHTDKQFNFTGNDITGDVTLSSTGDFQLSKDGITFNSSLSYSQAEANNLTKTVYARFAPSVNNQDLTGTVTITTSGLTATVNLKGTSIDPATTLEVVNWNLEWFGSTSLGPANDNQQQQNVEEILQSIGADIFGVVEVVDENRLATVVSHMPGYSYTVGQFGSHVNPPESGGGPLSEAQKLGFIYKNSVFSNVSAREMINALPGSNSYNNWSSGRFPYMLSADVTLNCVTKRVHFVLVHAKANTSPTATAYARRQASAAELHDTLVTYYPNDLVIMLGDFNDDLDQSITAGFTTTSYSSFTGDGANFFSPTLALSLAGKKSTVSYNDMIDHVILTNDMQPYYMPGTASVLSDVSSLVSNYGSTTTDHYPVFTRYRFEAPPAPTISCPGELVYSNDAGTCGAVITYTVNFHSYCGTGQLVQTAGIPSGSYFPVGTTTNQFVITDGTGNTATCSFTITVNDTEPPVLSDPETGCSSLNLHHINKCLANASAFNPASLENIVAGLYHDNCSGGVTAIYQGTTAGLNNTDCSWGFTYSYLITDAIGNSLTCSVTYEGGDSQPPSAGNPSPVFVQCISEIPAADPSVVTNESDNCGISSVSLFSETNNGGTGCPNDPFIVTRIYRVTDGCGNYTDVTQTLTASDNTIPSFTRPEDKTILFNSTCGYDASVLATGDVTNEWDNCSQGLEATFSDAISQCGNDIIIKRTWRLKDHCNNSAADQVQTIIVTDNNTDYIIYATKEAKFGENNIINGNVGVTASNGKAEFKKNSVLDPHHVYAANINVQSPAAVSNKHFLPATGGPTPPYYSYAGGPLSGNHNQTINGTVPAGNFKNLTIKKNITATIAGNNYGTITIEENAVVTFSSSQIDIEELFVKKGKNGNTVVKFSGCTGVRIKDRVTIEENTRINVNGPKVIVYVGDSKKDEENFSVRGDNTEITLNIMLPNGKLKINAGNSGTIMTGWYIVEKLESDSRNVTWNPYDCNMPPVSPLITKGNAEALLEDKISAFKVSVYPNPSGNEFNIRVIGTTDQPVSLRIFDETGKTIRIMNANANTVIKTGNELRPGIYFAEVSQGLNNQTIKLLKTE